jgi:hypothetical protein
MNRRFTLFREFGLVGFDHLLDIVGWSFTCWPSGEMIYVFN